MRFQVIGVALLAWGLTGCGSIANRPGGDFQVHVLDEGPFVARSRVDPIELRFSVEGCEQFTFGLDTSSLEEQRVRPLVLGSSGSDFVARVPVSWIAPEPGSVCIRDEQQPHRLHARLSVHCVDDGRTLESDPLEFSYATAWRVFELPDGIDAAAYHGDELLLLSGGTLEGRAPDGTLLHTTSLVPPPAEPSRTLLAEWNGRLQVWSSCAPGACGLSDQGLPNSELTPWFKAGAALVRNEPVRIPGAPFAIAPDGSERLVLLSEHGRVLVHLRPGEAPSVVLRTEDRLVTPFARNSTGLVYFGWDRATALARLRDADGEALFEVELPGSGEPEALFLSPDGAAWGLIRQGAVYVGRFGEDAIQLPTQLAVGQRPPQVGVAWFGGGLVVHGEQGIEVYGASVPHALRFRTEVSESTRILGVVGAADRLLVSTLDGVQIFGADGQVVGGAAPLPCGLGTTLLARPAGLDTAVLVAGRHVLTFKIR